MLVFNHYIITHKHDRLTILDSEANSSITFAPGEAGAITSLVSQAVGFLAMPALPEKIASGPFEVYFSDTGKCALTRADGEGHLEFTEGTHDEVVKVVEMLLNAYTDSKRLKSRAKGQRFGTSYPDPQF